MAKTRSRKMRLRNILRSFIYNTSLHGIKYVGDSRRHIFERSFWGFILIIFLTLSTKTVLTIWLTWKSCPMVITTSNVPYSISSLPVPAITVCHDIPLGLNSHVLSLENGGYLEMDDEEKNFKRFLDLVIPEHMYVPQTYPDNHESSCNNITESGVFRMKDETFLILFDNLIYTNQFSIDSKADSQASLTSDGPLMCFDTVSIHGYCFTCNMLPPSQIFHNNTVHHFFKTTFSIDPNSTFENQQEKIHGFPSVFVKTNNNQPPYKYPSLNKSPTNTFTYKATTNFDPDSKVYSMVPDIYRREFAFYTIHSPWDVPSPFMRWYYDKKFFNKELQILVDATHYMFTEQASFSRPPEERQCYLPFEKKLVYFKFYTRRNCLLECFTKKILQECKCVLYYLPHTEDTNICEHERKLACARRIMDDVNIEASWSNCGCLSSCNHTEYRAISREIISQPDALTQYTMVLRDDTIYPKIRRSADSVEELVQSSMTYLDMFLGLSLISIVEILYYALLIVMQYFGIKRTIRRGISRRSVRKRHNPIFTIAQCPDGAAKYPTHDQSEIKNFSINSLRKRISLFVKNEWN